MGAAHHPERIQRVDALLVSMNDRLGSIGAAVGAAPTGQDIIPMSNFYLEELIALAQDKAERIREATEEATRR